jgi:hypothetical protein
MDCRSRQLDGVRHKILPKMAEDYLRDAIAGFEPAKADGEHISPTRFSITTRTSY